MDIIRKNIEVYPTYQPLSAYFSFDLTASAAGSGTGTVKHLKVTTGQRIRDVISNPVMSGYRFLGWSTSVNGATGIYPADTKLYASDASVTLYAQWDKIKGSKVGEKKYAYQLYTKKQIYELMTRYGDLCAEYDPADSIGIGSLGLNLGIIGGVGYTGSSAVIASAVGLCGTASTVLGIYALGNTINDAITYRDVLAYRNFYRAVYEYMEKYQFNTAVLATAFCWCCRTDWEGCDYYEWQLVKPGKSTVVGKSELIKGFRK